MVLRAWYGSYLTANTMGFVLNGNDVKEVHICKDCI